MREDAEIRKCNIRVTPKRQEKLSETLRRFRKITEKEGIIKEIKKHAYYEKPSDVRRRAKVRAIRKAKAEELLRNSPPPLTDKDKDKEPMRGRR